MDYTVSRISEFFSQEFGQSYKQTVAVTLGLFLLYLFVCLRADMLHNSFWMLVLLKGLLLCISTAGILNLTLLNRTCNAYGKNFELELLWSYKAAVFAGDAGLGREIICNILLFVPWGLLMAASFPLLRKIPAMLTAAVMFSAAIELVQGVLKLGLFEFDDMINNGMGAVAGLFICNFIIWMRGKLTAARDRRNEKDVKKNVEMGREKEGQEKDM